MNTELEKIWHDIQGHLSRTMKGPSFQTWIKPSKLIELNENQAIIAVKNEFNKNFLKQCYLDRITAGIERIIKRKIVVEIVVKPDINLVEFVPSIASLQEEKGANKEPSKHSESSGAFFDHTFRFRTNLNPMYTFENFVVGFSNQFCHAACLGVAETQSELYNPLFIYSGVGLGKTHLIHAVANYVLRASKGNIKYTSSESFTNEVIQSIRTDNMSKFREKYRHLDLLIIDDIQFLAGKEATQEEFFHTFNTLKENGKQIILTADKPPTLLRSIADRLKSRFEGGLIADIQYPDLETRIAILLLKASRLNIDLPQDVAEYIATIFSRNIRELEGALKRIYAYLSITQEEINIRNVQKILSAANSSSCTIPSYENILKTIASFYSKSYEDLISPKRSCDLTKPRHVAIYILHDFYSLSFPRIGELFSNRTHSSAIYAYQKAKKMLEGNQALQEQINLLKGQLTGKATTI